MNNLTIGGIIQNSYKRGFQNLAPVLVNTLLWILTIWIPYLNVGTTIGLTTGVVSKMSRGETISNTEIFNPDYRKYMGEFFLVVGLMFLGINAGILFFIIPGIVISVAWLFAPLLVVDKRMNPMEAIHRSNEITYGKKWTIFLGYLIVVIATMIALGIILGILSRILIHLGAVGSFLTAVFGILGYAALGSIAMASMSYMYGELNRG